MAKVITVEEFDSGYHNYTVDSSFVLVTDSFDSVFIHLSGTGEIMDFIHNAIDDDPENAAERAVKDWRRNG